MPGGSGEAIEELKEQMSAWITKENPSIKDLPEEPACYVLILNGKYLYIGSTERLRGRMAAHLLFRWGGDSSYATKWGVCENVTLKYRPCRKFGDWAMVELRLIRRLNPSLNLKHRYSSDGRPRKLLNFPRSVRGLPMVASDSDPCSRPVSLAEYLEAIV